MNILRLLKNINLPTNSKFFYHQCNSVTVQLYDRETFCKSVYIQLFYWQSNKVIYSVLLHTNSVYFRFSQHAYVTFELSDFNVSHSVL